MNNNILSLKLKILYIVEFGAIACFSPFLTYYFQLRGLSYTQIGIAYAVSSITGVITQPIWGVITDKYLNKRTTMIITMVLSSVSIYNFVFAKNFYYILFSIALLLSFQSSLISVSDAYTYEIMDHHREIQYGRIRLMGSLGFAIIALFLGILIKYFGINSAFFLYSIIMFTGAMIVCSIDYKDKTTPQKIDLADITSLIKDRKFFVFIVAIVFANIANGSNGSYISLLIQETGGDVSQLGLLWFILAISELPIFFFGKNLLKKHGELNVFIVGMLLFTLRYFLDSICTSYVYVIMIQVMQGITFPLFFMAALEYLNIITPRKMKTSSMTFFGAACGLGAFIGNIGCGLLLEHISIFAIYRIISLMCLICIGFVVVLKKVNADHLIKNAENWN
ncbi:MFS transporter [Clostridium lacusfryxellense]|uniref:MFS transporter n=1 Tax=Clostridium lacusfryxellense TaxID=205328 RepID=UPI001C0AF096|nr:MFS transporter [Clostridium lacusfryxellense]MBU3111219.1 MFS transporter [Clostridium lacusfryxellense]